MPSHRTRIFCKYCSIRIFITIPVRHRRTSSSSSSLLPSSSSSSSSLLLSSSGHKK
ncbi:hypothetical protein LOAG_12933 [Loa loa]|uniref:Uncharacterized protein n=1 Tax=Loa loa TaxID=7209 RepID=A0A1S0TKC2_LOALO|nr:hypothetical protein LOAG_12933 [Loa loa]EFO15577.1 hypothetical protein LOAG_12933 [Loa loa]